MTIRALPRRVDVAIVGAGTAGAAAAAFCAASGMRVLCVDRREIDRAGAHWVNGVPTWMFRAAGLELPTEPELRGKGGRYHLVVGNGPVRMTIPDHDMLEVDMRMLVARLHEMARSSGAMLEGEIRALGLADGVLDTDRGSVEADWVVDASGLRGARLLEQPPVAPRDICVAAQQVRKVADRGAAASYFARHGVGLGEVVGFTGIAGGFSILNLRTSGDEINILTGSIPGDGHPSGPAMLEEFVAEHPWVGEVVFGGAGAIPLRRPFDRIATERVAAIGDAAAQVFSAHGSGIGAGMIAARALATALAEGRGTTGYALDWQRQYGGLLAAFDMFRRHLQTLTLADTERTIASGLTAPAFARQVMEQRFPRAGLTDLPRVLSAAAREPRRTARMAGVAAKMAAARVMYAGYPRDSAGLRAWSRRVARLFGDAPDVA